MEIRPAHESRLPPARALPPRSAAPQAGPGEREAQGDRFDATPPSPQDAPFWLVRMSTDRLARRQYLSPREQRAGEKLEQLWILELVERARALGLAPSSWQGLVADCCALAGIEAVPRVVWQAALKEGRGQYLFRLEGSLIQLRPGAPGTPSQWAATVAHEAFHHFQQELVVALYQEQPLAPPFDALAAYYRDARNAYFAPGPSCPPEAHRRQRLELGAWAFGGRMALTLAPGLSVR